MNKADYVKPAKINITYSYIDGSVILKMDEDISYAESLGMLEFAKMFIITKWQEENGGLIEEFYEEDDNDYDEDGGLFDEE